MIGKKLQWWEFQLFGTGKMIWEEISYSKGEIFHSEGKMSLFKRKCSFPWENVPIQEKISHFKGKCPFRKENVPFSGKMFHFLEKCPISSQNVPFSGKMSHFQEKCPISRKKSPYQIISGENVKYANKGNIIKTNILPGIMIGTGRRIKKKSPKFKILQCDRDYPTYPLKEMRMNLMFMKWMRCDYFMRFDFFLMCINVGGLLCVCELWEFRRKQTQKN